MEQRRLPFETEPDTIFITPSKELWSNASDVPLIIEFCGPSGGGKTEIMDYLSDLYPFDFVFTPSSVRIADLITRGRLAQELYAEFQEYGFYIISIALEADFILEYIRRTSTGRETRVNTYQKLHQDLIEDILPMWAAYIHDQHDEPLKQKVEEIRKQCVGLESIDKILVLLKYFKLDINELSAVDQMILQPFLFYLLSDEEHKEYYGLLELGKETIPMPEKVNWSEEMGIILFAVIEEREEIFMQKAGKEWPINSLYDEGNFSRLAHLKTAEAIGRVSGIEESAIDPDLILERIRMITEERGAIYALIIFDVPVDKGIRRKGREKDPGYLINPAYQNILRSEFLRLLSYIRRTAEIPLAVTVIDASGDIDQTISSTIAAINRILQLSGRDTLQIEQCI